MTITPARSEAVGTVVRRRPLLPTAWPLLLALYGYPLLWVLGLSSFIWSILVLPVGIHLLRRPTVKTPPGTGIWIVFLAWVALSAVQVDSGSTAAVFVYRASTYLAAGVLYVYVYNLWLTREEERQLLRAVAMFWGFLIVGGFAALVIPQVEFPSALEIVLPRSIANQEYVQQLIHPTMAQLQTFLGYPVPRPAAPFTFTNTWGSNVGLLAPVFFYTLRTLEGWRRRLGILVAGASLVPIVYSLNRGLWLGLAIVVVYAAVRYAIAGRVRPLIVTVAAGLVAVLAIALTPLGDLAEERAETGHSDSARMQLVEGALDAIADSPLIGHGGTVRIPERESRAPAGTHGQLWMIAVSHGVPAAVMFLAFIGSAFIHTWRGGPSSLTFWCNAMLVVLVSQLFIYTILPSQLPIMMMVLGLAAREEDVPMPTLAVRT